MSQFRVILLYQLFRFRIIFLCGKPSKK
jgi:hypothetical protein